MACPGIVTGERFLSRTLEHIDCQAQAIGSFGYQALGEPGSLASTLVTTLLTLFIALFAIRLLFGPSVSGRDVVIDIIKIGIVLTLAFSWPAFRTVIYDVTLLAPAEIANAIDPTPLAGGFAARLQGADDDILRLTELGTGRTSGAFIDDEAPGGTFEGSVLQDENAFGSGRLLYLGGLIGSLALLRIIAGTLLAVAPLAAGLLLFEQTRGLFSGWLRGLVLALAGSVGVTLVITVELALLEPWLADALRVRALGYAIPGAPTELLALTGAFALVKFAIVWVLARIAFTRGWVSVPIIETARQQGPVYQPQIEPSAVLKRAGRAERIAHSVENTVRREQYSSQTRLIGQSAASRDAAPASSAGSLMPGAAPQPRLGSSYRRSARRQSLAGKRRDAS